MIAFNSGVDANLLDDVLGNWPIIAEMFNENSAEVYGVDAAGQYRYLTPIAGFSREDVRGCHAC